MKRAAAERTDKADHRRGAEGRRNDLCGLKAPGISRP
jgi:hypothetical protein